MQTPVSRTPPDISQRSSQASGPKPRLLDQVQQAVRARHYSNRTEDTYVQWIRRFILFHRKRHPLEMGEPEINQFLTHLAVNKKVSASTQNQALAPIQPILHFSFAIHHLSWKRIRSAKDNSITMVD